MTIEQLCKIVSKHCKNQSFVTRGQRLTDDLSLCSFDIMLIVAEAEKEYGCKCSLSAASSIVTVTDLYNLFQ